MIDRRRAAQAIEEFLRALGRDLKGDLAGTGKRVADAWADDLIRGDAVDAAAILREGSMEAGPLDRGLVVARDLAVTTMCPHHLLPAHGAGTIAYLPGARMAGIGTLARVLDALARRLTLQERIGGQLVELLVNELGARGALCKLALTHTCLVARGERKAGAVIETVAVAGLFAEPCPERDIAVAAALAGGRV
ncbi:MULTISPECIES: GTP cyclohydrolase I [Sorangium]|uniref:GTP cyclohydrolase I n=1 Tax=Sorangium cellulosum TaxID=56 RepID=A0A4P2QW11_SORCE|nr:MULTISPECIES: GTP cyclohydrolase I [Sorangium]AUX34639.1 GTP cyclohydrolase [Sorangium cellulosum]WCQ93951.1 GTP cyclohydrolase 1 [Sorangium sp. Soce836]